MIGIFDSGVGGLSVLKELIALEPKLSFIYFADNANVPYGSKSKEFLLNRSLKIADYLVSKKTDCLVIACNTATAVAAEVLRSKLSVPVVAVEPPVKPAVAHSKNSAIAVLATKITLESDRYRNLISSYASGVKVVERVSNDLVPLVENNLLDSEDARQMIKQIADNFCAQGVDTLVLGSTHFYFLSDYIKQISNSKLTCFSPSEASARQALKIIQQNLTDSSAALSEFNVSGDPGAFNKSLKIIFPEDNFTSVQVSL